MPLYYHVQRRGARLKVGKSYAFGAEPNFYSRDLFAVSPSVHVRGVGDMPLDSVVKDCLDPNGFRHYRNVKQAHFAPDEKGLLACAGAMLNQQAMLLRELVFEQVRQEAFADKPSRQRCVWLIPHDEPLLAAWCATVSGSFHAFEVEASGPVHVGASCNLKPVCFSGDQLRDHARRYWSEPVDMQTQQAEILCGGEIKILREIKMVGTDASAWAKFKRLF